MFAMMFSGTSENPCKSVASFFPTANSQERLYWKRKGSGDSRGLQNRRSLSLMAMVGSTPTRFRHLVSMN
jgi:hypothetical protein